MALTVHWTTNLIARIKSKIENLIDKRLGNEII